MILQNLKLLKEDMELKDWIISSFLFSYNGSDYVVLVKRFTIELPKRNKYALVRLIFLDSDDTNRILELEANSKEFLIGDEGMVSITEFRDYFGIKYQDKLFDFMGYFYEYISRFIPTKVRENLENIERNCLLNSLNGFNNDEAGKIYPLSIKRNSDNGQRSIYNDNKTRILNPSLYKLVCEDKNISFCYTNDINRRKTNEEILDNFNNDY
ncbi:hypothetical protein AVBRAN12640_07495 [Campylobacter sp. RM12640]|uniref:DUF6037 family protein n=1 Tax=unclassified Campylobacter TaxID=2593542 RepID=UPI00301541AE|nr:hypothetical protein [Campylobacter sp. RM12640]MBZ7989560.1 hypothetical protein [Campylobacter sp. RM12635]